MEEHIVTVKSVHPVTHDVKSFRVSKPAGYVFNPGQATEVSINRDGWKDEKRPFTFTGLNHHDLLEFTIKIYKDHPGVTNELDRVQPGDELIIRDVWGAISYKGPGYFIAGGAGITPFIAILRELHHKGDLAGNRLFFSNKTEADIILHEELDLMLGKQVKYIVTGQKETRFEQGFINKEFLQKEIEDFSKPFYICGPDKMVSDLASILGELGASPDFVVFEK